MYSDPSNQIEQRLEQVKELISVRVRERLEQIDNIERSYGLHLGELERAHGEQLPERLEAIRGEFIQLVHSLKLEVSEAEESILTELRNVARTFREP